MDMRDQSVSRFIQDVGRLIHDVRVAMGLTQAELSRRSGVSQSQISRIERGRLEDLSIAVLDGLMRALGIRYWLETERPQISRSTSDLVHARCSAYVGRRLRAWGWMVSGEVEVGGDRSRGWIDLLAYHPTTKLLLVIEVKTEIVDVGAIERTLNWYSREASNAARRLGWRPIRTSAALLVLDSRSNDDRISSNRSIFGHRFPGRAPQLREVIAKGVGPVQGDYLALIDPRSRRRDWLRAARVDGRRTPSAYVDYIDATRSLERHPR
jgi:transcriptional regulator with XRE-family HTH domain